MVSLPTLDFQTLLVVFSVLIFALTLLLIFLSEKNAQKTQAKKLLLLDSPVFSKLLYRIHFGLLFVFIAVTAYSIWFSIRPSLYYALFASLFVTLLLLILTSAPEKRVLLKRTVLVTVIILAFTQSMLPTFQNRLIAFGPDQWPGVTTAKQIADQGYFVPVTTGSYYYTIPLCNLLNTAIYLFTGNAFISIAISLGTLILAITLAIYFVLLKLTKSQLASIIAVFVFLSTPRLAIVETIPSIFSLVLAAVLVMLLINCILNPLRATVVALAIISFAAIVIHPVGISVLIAICGGLLVLHHIGLVRQEHSESKMVLNLFGLFSIMTLAYWSFNQPIFNSIVNPLTTLLTTVSAPSSGPSVYTPNYFVSTSTSFSLVWALPVGISGAFVISYFYKILKNRKKISRLSKKTTLILPFVAGAVGLFFILVAFASIINAPGAAVERYVNTAAYLLLIFSSAVAAFQIIKSKQSFAIITMICLLAVSIFVGVGSPDWAVFENPGFTAVHSTYTGYVESTTMLKFLPNGTTVYTDNDLPDFLWMPELVNVDLYEPISYQTTRNVLDSVKNGFFNLTNPEYSQININATYIIKLSEISNLTVVNKYMNALYNSGSHVVFKTATNG
ncbi:MAG: hypothetical protein NWF05_02670 [Candidatus Bathyarchaeota archaeon]|nr:hypothetical protein [Candidatus Bathyarchaeota archaeon]